MTRADWMVFHRLTCKGCGYCSNRAEERRAAADEPPDDTEQSRRADTWERYMQGDQL